MKTDRILTTHTGSLPRPPAVLCWLKDREADLHHADPSDDALLGGAVAECVDKQLEAGIDIVSDGELAKPGYSTYVKDRLSGFGGEGPFPAPADLEEFPEYARRVLSIEALTSLRTPRCLGPVEYRDRRALDRDIERFRKALRGRADGFLTAASPGVIALFLRNAHYPTKQAYLEALADAMRTEYHAIHEAGFLLQLDAPDLALAGQTEFAGATMRELRKHLTMQLEALNYAVSEIPPSRMRIHVCWGNYEGPHHRDIELQEIVDLLLTARPSGISFAAANPRHAHEWSVWEHVRIPDDKILIPGVIDSTTNFIEHPALVAERILRFARIVGKERVVAGTDCGFSTFAGLHTVDPGIVWAKLSALVQGARIADRALRSAGPPSVVVAH